MNKAEIRLWWLPVGAGGHVVIHTSRWWEHWHALREGRSPRPLFHAALEILAPAGRYAVEMAPRGAGVPAAQGWWRLARSVSGCWDVLGFSGMR